MIPFNPGTHPTPRCCYCASPMKNVIGAIPEAPAIFLGQCPRCDGIVTSLPVLPKLSIVPPVTNKLDAVEVIPLTCGIRRK
jgi:hypothetical protein